MWAWGLVLGGRICSLTGAGASGPLDGLSRAEWPGANVGTLHHGKHSLRQET